MQDFFGVKVDTANMTLEELEEAQNKTREILSNLKYQIRIRKMAKNRHLPSNKPL